MWIQRPVWAAASPTDVFVVGDDGALGHFEGTAFESLSDPVHMLSDLWGDASGAAWAVGDAIFRRRDGRWAAVDPKAYGYGVLWTVSGSSSDDIWMAGGTFALHWMGTRSRDGTRRTASSC